MSSLYLIRNAWADVTNISAATRYYPTMDEDVGALLGQATELRLAFDCGGGVTLTVEYCGQVLGDAVPASADWVDVTLQGHPIAGGAGAASYVDAKNTLVFVLPPGRVRVKIVTSDATNAVQLISTLQPIGAANINAAITASALPAGAATEARQTSDHCTSVAAKTAPATPAAAEAIAASTACHTGVLIAASESNGNIVYIGGSGVTVATGIPMSAGDTLFLPVTDAALVFCVGGAAAQVVKAVVL